MRRRSSAPSIFVAFTGDYDRPLQKRLNVAVQKLGAKVIPRSSKWDPRTTYLVADAPSRNFKFLCALVSESTFLVRSDFLLDSQEQGKFLDTEPYTWNGDGFSGRIWMGTAKLWKNLWRKNGNGPLHGHSVAIIGKLPTRFQAGGLPTAAMLRALLESAGAKLADHVSSTTFILADPRLKEDHPQISQYIKQHIVCLGPAFLVDLIATASVAVTDYLLYPAQKDLTVQEITPTTFERCDVVPISRAVQGRKMSNEDENRIHEEVVVTNSKVQMTKTEKRGTSQKNKREPKELKRKSSAAPKKRRRVQLANDISARPEIAEPIHKGEDAGAGHFDKICFQQTEEESSQDTSDECKDNEKLWSSAGRKESFLDNLITKLLPPSGKEKRSWRSSPGKRKVKTTTHNSHAVKDSTAGMYLLSADKVCREEWKIAWLSSPSSPIMPPFLRIAGRSLARLQDTNVEHRRIQRTRLIFAEDDTRFGDALGKRGFSWSVLAGTPRNPAYVKQIIENCNLWNDAKPSKGTASWSIFSEDCTHVNSRSPLLHSKGCQGKRVTLKTPPRLAELRRARNEKRSMLKSNSFSQLTQLLEECADEETPPSNGFEIKDDYGGSLLGTVEDDTNGNTNTSNGSNFASTEFSPERPYLTSKTIPAPNSLTHLDITDTPHLEESTLIGSPRCTSQKLQDEIIVSSPGKWLRNHTLSKKVKDQNPRLGSPDQSLFQFAPNPKSLLMGKAFDVNFFNSKILNTALDVSSEALTESGVVGNGETAVSSETESQKEDPLDRDDCSQHDYSQPKASTLDSYAFSSRETRKKNSWVGTDTEDMFLEQRCTPILVPFPASQGLCAATTSIICTSEDDRLNESSIDSLFYICGMDTIGPASVHGKVSVVGEEVRKMVLSLLETDLVTWFGALCEESLSSPPKLISNRCAALVSFFDRIFQGRPQYAIVKTILDNLLNSCGKRLRATGAILSFVAMLREAEKESLVVKVSPLRCALAVWLMLIQYADSSDHDMPVPNFWTLFNERVLVRVPEDREDLPEWRLWCVKTVKHVSYLYLFALDGKRSSNTVLTDETLLSNGTLIRPNWHLFNLLFLSCKEYDDVDGSRFLLRYLRMICFEVANRIWPVSENAVSTVVDLVHNYYGSHSLPCKCTSYPKFLLHFRRPSIELRRLEKIVEHPCNFAQYMIWLWCCQSTKSKQSKINSATVRFVEGFLKSPGSEKSNKNAMLHVINLVLAAADSFASEKLIQLHLISSVSKLEKHHKYLMERSEGETKRDIILSALLFRCKVLMKSNRPFGDHIKHFAHELDRIVKLLVNDSKLSRGSSTGVKDSTRLQRCVLESAFAKHSKYLADLVKTSFAVPGGTEEMCSSTTMLDSMRPVLSEMMASAILIPSISGPACDVIAEVLGILEADVRKMCISGDWERSLTVSSHQEVVSALLGLPFLQNMCGVMSANRVRGFMQSQTNMLSFRVRCAKSVASIVAISKTTSPPSDVPDLKLLLSETGLDPRTGKPLAQSPDGRVVCGAFWSKLLSVLPHQYRSVMRGDLSEALFMTWSASLCAWETTLGAIPDATSFSSPLLQLTRAFVDSTWVDDRHVLSNNPLVNLVKQDRRATMKTLASTRMEGLKCLFNRIDATVYDRTANVNPQTPCTSPLISHEESQSILRIIVETLDESFKMCSVRANQGYSAVTSNYLQFSSEVLADMFARFPKKLTQAKPGRPLTLLPLKLLFDTMEQVQKSDISPDAVFYRTIFAKTISGFEALETEDAIVGVYITRFIAVVYRINRQTELVEEVVKFGQRWRQKMLHESIVAPLDHGSFDSTSFAIGLEVVLVLVRTHVVLGLKPYLFLSDIDMVMKKLCAKVTVEGRTSPFLPARFAELALKSREKCYELVELIHSALINTINANLSEYPQIKTLRELQTKVAYLGMWDLEAAMIGGLSLDSTWERKLYEMRRRRVNAIATSTSNYSQCNTADFPMRDPRISINMEQSTENVSVAISWCKMMNGMSIELIRLVRDDLALTLSAEEELYHNANGMGRGYTRIIPLTQLASTLLAKCDSVR